MTITPEEARQILKTLHWTGGSIHELAARLRAHAASDLKPLPELGKDRVWHHQNKEIVRAKSKAAATGILIDVGNRFSHYTIGRFNSFWRETKDIEHLAAATSPGVFEKRNGEWVKLEGKT